MNNYIYNAISNLASYISTGIAGLSNIPSSTIIYSSNSVPGSAITNLSTYIISSITSNSIQPSAISNIDAYIASHSGSYVLSNGITDHVTLSNSTSEWDI